RAGEIGRAWAAIADAKGEDADALRAELERRRGEARAAERAAKRAAAGKHEPARSFALATLARLAWDAGELERAEELLAGARGARAAEMRGLVAYRRGAFETGLRAVAESLAEVRDAEGSARLFATRGMLEHARGDAAASLAAFERAADGAARAGA